MILAGCGGWGCVQLGDISMQLFNYILYLNSKWCNILSLVNVVVQAGGQGQEAVGGDVEVLHHVSVEGERKEGRDCLCSHHCVGQT